MSESISDLVPATLSQLGLPVPSDVIHTMLIRDCRFVGYKLSYDGGYAVWESGGNTLEFYNQEGKLLTTVALETWKGAA